MVALDFQTLFGLSEQEIRKQLASSSAEIRISYEISEYYGSSSRWVIAESALILWYIAEQLADFAKDSSFEVIPVGIQEAGLATVTLKDVDPVGLAACVAELLPAFEPDPDDIREEWFYLSECAAGWLESKSDVHCHFPRLRDEFRQDQADAREYEPEECDEGD